VGAASSDTLLEELQAFIQITYEVLPPELQSFLGFHISCNSHTADLEVLLCSLLGSYNDTMP
jgi:hypothetical protein